MWLGISRNVHGYSAIDTDEQVTVRSEVARLTRLYDRAVKTNTMNDPDMYAAGMITDFHSAALKGAVKPGTALPAPAPADPAANNAVATPAPVAPATADDPDESPVTKPTTTSPPAPDTKKDSMEPSDAKKDGPAVPGAAKDEGPASSEDAKKETSKPEETDAKPGAVNGAKSALDAHDPDESPASAAHPVNAKKDGGEPAA